MKKFVAICTAAALVMLGVCYAVFVKGFYIDFNGSSQVRADFTTAGQEIRKGDGKEAFLLKGVDVSASVAGHYLGDFAADEDTYLRWLGNIQDMGANTVRVYTIMDDDFYNAFYAFNSNAKSPLYLVQGIRVSEAANYGMEDASEKDFLGQLKEDAKKAVDVVHGKSVASLNEGEANGVYLKDVSKWTLGYQIGDEWSGETVAYTDHNPRLEHVYQGRYFTTKDASNFECILAQVMDLLVEYETDKYKCQRLVTFICDPSVGFLEYEEEYARMLSKFCHIDPEHIRPTDELKSGYFATYKLFRFCDGFLKYLSAGQKQELMDVMDSIHPASRYDGYLELLKQYHTMPVAAGFQYSTSRGKLKADEPALTEEQQGRNLVTMYDDLVSAGWSGGFISTWQDAWEQKSWNTAFASVLPQNSLWHDLQTVGQNYGIMAFVPGEEDAVCLVDGDASEWSKEDEVLESREGYLLSAKYDAEGMYLLIQGSGISDRSLYVPIDTLQERGAKVYTDEEGGKASFDRDADFVLCVDGTGNSRLLVNGFSDGARINFMEEVDGRNPFIDTPKNDTNAFYVSRMAVEKPLDLEEKIELLRQAAAGFVPSNMMDIYPLEFYDTGRLVPGNGNPESPEYHSLADICFGKDMVEIRLPWLMLNFSNPSARKIHGDYYSYYGVQSQDTARLWIGLGEKGSSQRISMEPVALEGWGEGVPCHERLKKSYYIIQDEWREGK